MNRSEITSGLSTLLERRLRSEYKRFAREVVFSHPECRVDYVSFKFAENWYGCAGGVERGVATFYEVKSCLADYNSGNGLNFLGDENYLVMPVSLGIKLRGKSLHGAGVYYPVPVGSTLRKEFLDPTPYNGAVQGWSLHKQGSDYKAMRQLPIAEILAQMIYAGVDYA